MICCRATRWVGARPPSGLLVESLVRVRPATKFLPSSNSAVKSSHSFASMQSTELWNTLLPCNPHLSLRSRTSMDLILRSCEVSLTIVRSISVLTMFAYLSNIHVRTVCNVYYHRCTSACKNDYPHNVILSCNVYCFVNVSIRICIHTPKETHWLSKPQIKTDCWLLAANITKPLRVSVLYSISVIKSVVHDYIVYPYVHQTIANSKKQPTWKKWGKKGKQKEKEKGTWWEGQKPNPKEKQQQKAKKKESKFTQHIQEAEHTNLSICTHGWYTRVVVAMPHGCLLLAVSSCRPVQFYLSLEVGL